MALNQEDALYRDGYNIGLGVEMATGDPMNRGVQGAIGPPAVGGGGGGTYTFNRVQSTTDLETALGIGADVSAGIGLFSASASFKFSKDCKIQTSSLAVMVSAEEYFAFQQIDEPKLSDAAAHHVEQHGLNSPEFTNQFGEYFIRGIRTGGRFFGVVRIDTKSAESKLAVDAALSGSYAGVVDADVKVTFRETLKSANARVAAFIIFEGGHITTRPTSPDPIVLLDQLYKAMDEWTATVRTEPKPYGVTLAPYRVALGPTPPNLAEIEHQRDVLIRCAKLRAQTLDKLNLIEYILDPNHMNEFEIVPPPPTGPDLPALQAALAGDLDVIAQTASYATNNIKEAREPEKYMNDIKGISGFKFTALPTNLPRHTGGPIVVPSIQVRSLRGLDHQDIRLILQNNLKTELDIVNYPDNVLGVLFNWTQEKLDFFWSGVVFKCLNPNGEVFKLNDNPQRIEVRDQSPSAGLLAPGNEVTLLFKQIGARSETPVHLLTRPSPRKEISASPYSEKATSDSPSPHVALSE
jgi:hypothetical protein